MSNNPSFSIVINTLNRELFLQRVLDSLRWLKYSGEFEVIVINGPSTDHSDEVITSWLPHIRAEKCDFANLSISRNIGICMAQGDIIAFLDDDAIPEPEWLSQMAKAYQDPMVGAVGGLVYNHTGYDFQYKYCLVDRFGNADLSIPSPTPHLSFPKSFRFPHLLGCNSSFRRSVLMKIGGFDDEYEYFLDETDVCLRIIDAGYIIAQLPCAYVHHKYAASNIRNENKVSRYRYPIIKNKIYFTLKHAREFYPLERILQEQQSFIQQQRNDVNWAVGENLLPESAISDFNADLELALEIGLKRGLEGVAIDALIDKKKREKYAGKFSPFIPIKSESYKSIVLISQDFPPNHSGGIATFNKDLAEALAAQGNIVHIITQSHDINRVDFENGVWVHRMVTQEIDRSAEANERKIPQHIWNWSATALEECKRISTHRKIDVVEAPIWDCEGIAFLLDKTLPLVTSLQTTLHFWLETHSNFYEDKNWITSFGSPMLTLEQEVMQKADAVRAISAAIKNEIETSYNFKFNVDSVQIAPLGLRQEVSILPLVHDGIEILFVGRLESRKGIDILLEVIPDILLKHSNVSFKIVGDNSLPSDNGETYMFRFLKDHKSADWLSRVSFSGKVSQEELNKSYLNCDIFVAPSKFESFGLVFLEAMRVGKPVIGCLAGGMPEIISDGENGLLIPPNNAKLLANALKWMLEHDEERIRMGQSGLRTFESCFTAKRMAEQSISLYDLAIQRYRARAI